MMSNMKPNEGEVRELIEALEAMASQWCTQKDGMLDSCALSANAKVLRILGKYGIVNIEHEVGRRVMGRWSNPERQAEAERLAQLRHQRSIQDIKDKKPFSHYDILQHSDS
jgi:hypothetical protein